MKFIKAVFYFISFIIGALIGLVLLPFLMVWELGKRLWNEF